MGVETDVYQPLNIGASAQNHQTGVVAEQRRQFDIGIGFGEPRREAETAALNELRNVLGLDGDRDFSAFEGGPGFAFARDEALQAVERSAAARGGLVPFSGKRERVGVQIVEEELR